MKKYEIAKKKTLTPEIGQISVYAPLVAAKAKAGQFIILRVDEEGERIPLTISSAVDGLITVIYQKIGGTTLALSLIHILCKPLLPVYDKPLIYYPIAILMQAGISDILVIVPPGEIETFEALLGDGSQYGTRISFAEQPVARGIADALLIGQSFVGNDRVCIVLGDNLFYAPTLAATLKRAAANDRGATVFGYWVEDPRPFGVVEFDKDGRAISIEEKPRYPKMCIRDRGGADGPAHDRPERQRTGGGPGSR